MRLSFPISPTCPYYSLKHLRYQPSRSNHSHGKLKMGKWTYYMRLRRSRMMKQKTMEMVLKVMQIWREGARRKKRKHRTKNENGEKMFLSSAKRVNRYFHSLEYRRSSKLIEYVRFHI